ncbi:MAG: HDOD domain-containing protein [Nitrospirales bacterium]
MKTQGPTASPTSFLNSLLEDAPETLPILRQSCIQVLNLTKDSRSSAGDVGDVIMRDQALMANVIKIANSAAFHTRVPVKTPTHAVAIIGFDVIQAMTVGSQLIEQADAYGANTKCLKHLLARALVAGTHAQEMGNAMNFSEPGFLFTNAMLYSLGDLILALCRPEYSEQLEAIRQQDPDSIPKAELALLGRPLRTIASAMARHWHLPDTLINLLEKKPVWPATKPTSDQQIMEGIVHAANNLSYALLNPTAKRQGDILKNLIEKFLPPYGFSFNQLKQISIKAFLKTSEMAKVINIEPHHLAPVIDKDQPTIHFQPLNQLTQAIQHALNPEENPPETVTEPEHDSVPPPPTRPAPISDHLLFDFTLQAMKIREASTLITLASKTLYASYGFERVLLALVTPNKEKITGKMGFGTHVDSTVPLFQVSLDPDTFCYRLLTQYQTLRYHSLEKEPDMGDTPEEFLNQWGPFPGLVGALYAPKKPIGLIFADRGATEIPLTEADFATFSIVLSQTNANLARITQQS